MTRMARFLRAGTVTLLATSSLVGVARAAASQSVYIGNAGSSVTSYPLSATGNVTPSSDLSFSTFVGSLAFDHAGDLWVGLGSGATNGTLQEFLGSQLGVSGTVTPAVAINSSVPNESGAAFDGAGDLWSADYNAGSVGGFNWSSQRLMKEGCDGKTTGVDEGVDGPGSDAVAGPAGDRVAIGSGGVLVGDR